MSTISTESKISHSEVLIVTFSFKQPNGGCWTN